MGMHTITLAGVSVDAPATWADITGELEQPMPFTLRDTARDLGALQFSVATYKSGPVPDPSPAALLQMARELAMAAQLTALDDARAVQEGGLRIGALGCCDGSNYIHIWYVSDGRNIAKITYTCGSGEQSMQMAECEAIIRTLRFG